MAVEIISRSISPKVWDRAEIKLTTPGFAARHVSVVMSPTALRGPVGEVWLG